MDQHAVPFESFTRFERVPSGNPLFYLAPPEWAAAAHAFVDGDTVHYLWTRRRRDNYWEWLHSSAPADDPTDLTSDPANPVFQPTGDGWESHAVEYPFPFRNPADGRVYAYYLGRSVKLPRQTGLAISDGAFGPWQRLSEQPVIAAEAEFEAHGSSHPSVAIDGETIHLLYTGEAEDALVICHATASIQAPAVVTKDLANPVFRGSGEEWDSEGVREAEILAGPGYFDIFYGGRHNGVWRIGHVRTTDFRSFEPNPHNPIFCPSEDPEAWDSDGVLTPQVFALRGRWYMLYAGRHGREWQSGLAVLTD